MFELSVKVSDDEQDLVQKHLVYEENVTLSHDDPILVEKVRQATAAFKGEPTDIILRIKYTW